MFKKLWKSNILLFIRILLSGLPSSEHQKINRNDLPHIVARERSYSIIILVAIFCYYFNFTWLMHQWMLN